MNKELIRELKKEYWVKGIYSDVPFIEASSPVTGAVMASILAHVKDLVITKAHIEDARSSAEYICFGSLPWQRRKQLMNVLTKDYRNYDRHGWDYTGHQAGSTSLSQPGGLARRFKDWDVRRAEQLAGSRHLQLNLILQGAAKHVREAIMSTFDERVRYHEWVGINDRPKLLKDNIVIWPNKRFCIIAKPPSKLLWNNNRQLHNTKGYAVRYSDGFKVAFVLGIRVNSKYIEDPKLLTAGAIFRTNNTETQRALIELMGPKRYLKDAKADLVHEAKDRLGKPQRLWSLMRGLRMLETINSTPEPDGTYKTYYLTVPGHIHRCDDAIQWMIPARGINQRYSFRIET